MTDSLAFEVSSDESPQSLWLKQLDMTTTPGDLEHLVVDFVKGYVECAEAKVLWNLDDKLQQENEDLKDSWLDDAVVTGTTRHASTRHEVVLRLCENPRPVLLLLTLQDGCDPEPFITALQPMLHLAGSHLGALLKQIDMKRSPQLLERSGHLHQALFAIAELAASSLSVPDILRDVHTVVQTLMYAENFFVALYDDGDNTVRYIYYVDNVDTASPTNGDEIPLTAIEHSLAWHVISSGKSFLGTTAEVREQLSEPHTVIGTDSIDWLGVPMRQGTQVRGVVAVQSYRIDKGFSEDDQALLELIGGHILVALERKLAKQVLEKQVLLRTLELTETVHELQRQVNQRKRAELFQTALFQITQLATADIEIGAFYQRVHAAMGLLLEVKNFAIVLASWDGMSLRPVYDVNEFGESLPSKSTRRDLHRHVFMQGRPMTGDAGTIRQLIEAGEIGDWTGSSVPSSWLVVPLVTGGKTLGLISLLSYRAAITYTEADLDLLNFVASQIAISLDRRRTSESLRRLVQERTRDLCREILGKQHAQEQLSHLVMHDALTDLPNRRCLHDRVCRVQQATLLEPDRSYALLYLDVDRFKSINDSRGHLAGDEVLREMAGRLAGCIRQPNLVARLSGDEFAVLLENVGTSAEVMQMAQRLMDVLDEPLQIAGRELKVSASMGIVICDGHYRTVDQVLLDADLALYRAKRLGRGRFELFNETLAKELINNLVLEDDLRHALQQNQFEPYFQPICSLESGLVVGYEALIRWHHPSRGLLEPSEFLEAAKDCKLIEDIDWKMFELSFMAFAQHAPEGIYLTINVPAVHLNREDFDTKLVSLLERNGLPPGRIVMEITEDSVLDNPESARLMMLRLRDYGIGSALDDFGTGYSSLRYLHTLPLCMLKIDRNFVNELEKSPEIDSSTVVSAILALAKTLGIEVIAEGIETQEHRDKLIAMGCRWGQGYLFGYPAPISYGTSLLSVSTNACPSSAR
ncbi:EAL domain-containing protein [Rhodanobacter sp. Si-c]|uniref:EAL domain-containing protein n=1 Tax=Rhodanobacter lycopersici TaxID=3162487 RepID=A0ABV3QJ34_9GAMM